MFIEIELTQAINISPIHFGASVRSTVIDKLVAKVEGKCFGDTGYVILVKSIKSISDGKTDDTYGHVQFVVVFLAVVFRPFRGEVLDAQISSVNKNGLYAQCGPLSIYVSKHRLPSEFTFDPSYRGEPVYVSKQIGEYLKKNDIVRLRIDGLSVEMGETYAVGTMDESFLGGLIVGDS